MVSKNYKFLISISIFTTCLFGTYFLYTPFSFAETVDELNEQIDSYADKIKAIEKEIEQQRLLIQSTSAKAGDIQSKINSLNATKNKLQKDITRTQDVIKKSEITIQKIDIEMTDKERKIASTQKGLAESLRDLNQHTDISIIEIAMDAGTISEFLTQIVEVRKFKEILIDKKYELLNLNRELSQKKSEEVKTKEELEKERLILAGQQQTVVSTQNEHKGLLNATKSEQAKYEQLLREKEAQKQQFNALVQDIESKIKKLIDPESFPSAQNSILAWPLDNIIITQHFGGSDFAKQNPGIYGRPYHPGTDFGTPTGTKIKSVSSGKVRASGNTDAYPGCVAWGKWILVDHDNGLSSLYAHLSSILVSNGQSVASGEVIALSGNTGYSTGPHLHLTVYATQGVEVGKYGTYKPGGAGCAATDASGPFADLDAYLDPMSYLPSL
jgi:murein DD-endopeptidase MepM/ murein hydrolase activator NlpD